MKTWEQANLCMWDRSLWGRPRRQQERLQGRKVSGIPVWSACPSGTAGRRKLEEVQTHLRKSHRGEQKNEKAHKKYLHWISEQALIHAASCRVQSGFTWLRSTAVWILFGRVLNKAVRNSPFGRSCRCEKQKPQDNIFQMHESYLCKLGFLFPSACLFLQQVRLLYSTPFALALPQCCFLQCVLVCLVNST